MQPYYEQDGITIYHGDCCDVIPQLSSERPELTLTDPPYSIGATRGEWGVTAAVAIGLYEAAKKTARSGSVVAFTTTSGRGIEFVTGAVRRAHPFNRLLVWRKTGGRSRAMSPWRWDAVAVLVFGRAPDGRSAASSVCDTAVPPPGEHPSEIPAAVAEWCYAPFDAPDLLVLDPFMGTGALLLPAVRRGRRVVGIELEEKYCEIAAKRLAQGALDLFGKATA